MNRQSAARPPEPPPQAAALEASQFRTVFDSVSDAIFVQDPESGATLDLNQRVCEIFGYTREEAFGLDLGKLGLGLPPYTREEADAWIAKALDEGPQTFEWLSRTRDGHMFWVEVHLGTILLDGAQRLLMTARDIRDRKRIEVENAARVRRAEAQNAVSMALAGTGLGLDTALTLIARHLTAQLGDLCVLDLLDETGRLNPAALDQAYLDGAPLMPALTDLEPLPPGSPGPGEVAGTGRAINLKASGCPEILALLRPPFARYVEHFTIHSLLIVPMRHQGRIVGTITMAKGGGGRPYSFEDQSVLQNLADRAALTITNARLFAENLAQAEALKQANAELEQRVAERTAELEEANARLQQLATQDGLTGLSNRRHFDTVLEAELRRAQRAGAPLALLLSDVDFFKRYNDCYGHLQGDACLQMVGRVLRDIFRRSGELPARYGGEEFAVILPGVDHASAQKVAEKLRAAIEAEAMPHERSDAAPCVTLSIGLAWAPVMPGRNADWFITRADEALYRSKARGRNRVSLMEGEG